MGLLGLEERAELAVLEVERVQRERKVLAVAVEVGRDARRRAVCGVVGQADERLEVAVTLAELERGADLADSDCTRRMSVRPGMEDRGRGSAPRVLIKRGRIEW